MKTNRQEPSADRVSEAAAGVFARLRDSAAAYEARAGSAVTRRWIGGIRAYAARVAEARRRDAALARARPPAGTAEAAPLDRFSWALAVFTAMVPILVVATAVGSSVLW
jgi:hypothetical protein